MYVVPLGPHKTLGYTVNNGFNRTLTENTNATVTIIVKTTKRANAQCTHRVRVDVDVF